jgi:hypothetical protein
VAAFCEVLIVSFGCRYVPNASLPNAAFRQAAPQTVQQPPQPPHLQSNQPAMLTGIHISGPIPMLTERTYTAETFSSLLFL